MLINSLGARLVLSRLLFSRNPALSGSIVDKRVEQRSMLGCYAILFVDVDSTSIHKMRHGYSTV